MMTCVCDVFAIGVNFSSAGGGSIAQSGKVTIVFAGIWMLNGQMGYQEFAGVASKRKVVTPLGKPTSVKLPPASVTTWLVVMSCRAMMPAMP